MILRYHLQAPGPRTMCGDPVTPTTKIAHSVDRCECLACLAAERQGHAHAIARIDHRMKVVRGETP